MKQECIPVGGVPSTTVAVCWGVSGPGGEGVWSRGVSARGVCFGGCLIMPVGLVPGGVSCLGGLLQEGVPAPGKGGVVSQHALRQTPVDRQTGVKT